MMPQPSAPKRPARRLFPHAAMALAILFAGLGSAALSGSAYTIPWFLALRKPWFMPPASVFPVVWTCLYLLMGIVLGDLIAAKGARARKPALALFGVQLALNLAWSPLFFGARQPAAALALIVLLDIAVLATVIAVGRVRRSTAALLLPYCAWLALATALNAAIVRLN